MRAIDLRSFETSLADAWTAAAGRRRMRLDTLERELVVTSPLHVLQRGYSVTTGPDGSPIRSPDEVATGQLVTTRVALGEFRSRVTDATPAAPLVVGPAGASPPPPRAPAVAMRRPRRRGDQGGADRDQLGLFGSGGSGE